MYKDSEHEATGTSNKEEVFRCLIVPPSDLNENGRACSNGDRNYSVSPSGIRSEEMLIWSIVPIIVKKARVDALLNQGLSWFPYSYHAPDGVVSLS